MTAKANGKIWNSLVLVLSEKISIDAAVEISERVLKYLVNQVSKLGPTIDVTELFEAVAMEFVLEVGIGFQSKILSESGLHKDPDVRKIIYQLRNHQLLQSIHHKFGEFSEIRIALVLY